MKTCEDIYARFRLSTHTGGGQITPAQEASVKMTYLKGVADGLELLAARNAAGEPANVALNAIGEEAYNTIMELGERHRLFAPVDDSPKA